MVNIVSKVLKIFTSVLLAITIILAMLLVGLKVFGLQIYTVLSPSMEPNYKTGSLIYVKKIKPEALKEKDVITFKLTETTTATHRIIEIVADENNPSVIRFRTKGDNNDDPDTALVETSAVLGKVIFTIPVLGFVASYIQNPPGIYIALCFAGVLVLLVLVSDMITSESKHKKEEKQEE